MSRSVEPLLVVPTTAKRFKGFGSLTAFSTADVE
jgi:hypothetical protein